jgi:hypothetical protein
MEPQRRKSSENEASVPWGRVVRVRPVFWTAMPKIPLLGLTITRWRWHDDVTPTFKTGLQYGAVVFAGMAPKARTRAAGKTKTPSTGMPAQ